MKKENFFKEVEKISKANELTNKVEINAEASYEELHKMSISILDDIDTEYLTLLKKSDSDTRESIGYANNIIKLELLVNQMNVNHLFEAFKNTPNDAELKQQLEEAKLQLKECHAKESTYFA